MTKLDHVDYNTLDAAKNAFINASRRTLMFAEKYGFIPGERLGASANVFSLNITSFLQNGQESLYCTLLPEGLGTADDAKPDDLTEEELYRFWHNTATKTMGTLTNDVASAGMQPILVSLYLPSSTPETVFTKGFLTGFLDGFVAGCKEVGCVYFSGETPQLKNKIYPEKLDIAGAVFGILPAKIPPIDGSSVDDGNSIVFLESTGPDANGFTSLRKLAEDLPQGYRTKLPSGKEYWEAINNPTILYAPLIQDILKQNIILTGIEPISGHGWQKLMRSSKPLQYNITQTLPVPEIFQFLEKQLELTPEKMISIFNYGVGMAVYTKTNEEAEKVVTCAKEKGINAVVAGIVSNAEQRSVVVEKYNCILSAEGFGLQKG